jgi:hypothetical protein
MLKIYQNSSDTHGANSGRTKYKTILIKTHNYRICVCCACKHDMNYRCEESKNNKSNLNFTPFRETTNSRPTVRLNS